MAPALEKENRLREELQAAAIEYAKQGFRVFPLRPRTKEPATKHGFKDATTSIEQIRAWWLSGPYNIGIATGHGLVVVDIDQKPEEQKYGMDSLRDWEKSHGEFTPTWICMSGTGGLHYWYRSDEDFKNSVELLPGIDIRSEGGYIVAPPSVHPNGNPYEWEASGDPSEVKMADLTGSALEMLQNSSRTHREGAQRATYRDNETISEGGRTAALVSLEGSLLNLNLTAEAIEAAVREENHRKCDPPLTDEELEKNVFPFLRRGIIPTGDYADTIVPTDGREFAEPAYVIPKPVPFREIWGHLPPLAPPVIEGVLRQGHKMILSGPSKAGKSFLMLDLAYAIAEGMNWLGNRCRQGKVLYANLEIEEASFDNRLYQTYMKYGKNVLAETPTENLVPWNLRGYGIDAKTLTRMVIESLRGKGFAAVIIDPLYKIMDGLDENSNKDVASVSKYFDMIARETGACVVYAHHFAKGYAGDRSSIDRGSGAGAFARDPDAILTMTQLDIEEGPKGTAWRVEYTLREFANKKPTDVWWNYPMHTVDEDLADYGVVTSTSERKKAADSANKRKRQKDIEAAVDACEKVDDRGGFTTTAFEEIYSAYESVSRNTAETRLRNAGYVKTTEKTGSAGIWHRFRNKGSQT